jgi:hypothetical protein
MCEFILPAACLWVLLACVLWAYEEEDPSFQDMLGVVCKAKQGMGMSLLE